MFCPKCGSELKENAKFCESCGAPAAGNQPSAGQSAQASSGSTINDIKNQISFTDKTRYAGTSFWCSILALPLMCCGIGFLLGIPAVIFGALAIKNQEAEGAKAWIGVILGFIEVCFLLLLIVGMIRSEA